jgi:ribosome-associated protein
MLEQNLFIDKIIDIAENKKGLNIKKYIIKNLTNIADYVIVIEALNNIHAKVLQDEIWVQLKKEGFLPAHFEGLKKSEWVVLDYGDVLVNIMTEQSRDYYQIDDLFKNLSKGGEGV